jgi:hypothetical protein
MRSFQELLDEAIEITSMISKESIEDPQFRKDMLSNMVESMESFSITRNMCKDCLRKGRKGVTFSLEGQPEPIVDFYKMFLVYIQSEMTRSELEKLLDYYCVSLALVKDNPIGISVSAYDRLFQDPGTSEGLDDTRLKFISTALDYIRDSPYFDYRIYYSIIQAYRDKWHVANQFERYTPFDVYAKILEDDRDYFVLKDLWRTIRITYSNADVPLIDSMECSILIDNIECSLVDSLFFHFLFSFREGLHSVPTKSARNR